MTKQELQLILEEGEGYRIEFREALSGLDKGITLNNSLKSRIQSLARNCDPAIKIILREYRTTEEKDILLKPLLESGVLAQTIPDKPRSPKQKYVTVKKGEEKQ